MVCVALQYVLHTIHCFIFLECAFTMFIVLVFLSHFFAIVCISKVYFNHV